ncbi:MAG: hypothetical protein KME03_18010 [Aphanocapsa lilacina HA4352-LM1]|jgi:hypothetical protein|nr:hypothetical protein [Aphanocapsa lilacina HA4352-LM1]
MSDPLQEFLRRNAPEPPAPARALEEHILEATLAPAPALPRMSRRPPALVAAASLTLLLLGGLGFWQQQQSGNPKGEPPFETAGLNIREPDTFFAVDPQTDLYDVRF